MRLGRPGGELHRFLQVNESVVQLTTRRQRLAEVRVGLGKPRLQPDGFAQGTDGLVRSSPRRQRGPEIVETIGRVRVESHCLPEVADRVLALSLLLQHGSEIDMGRRVFWIDREAFLVGADRLVEPPSVTKGVSEAVIAPDVSGASLERVAIERLLEQGQVSGALRLNLELQVRHSRLRSGCPR